MLELHCVKICVLCLWIGCWFQTRKNNQGRASNCKISVWHRSMERVDTWCSGNATA